MDALARQGEALSATGRFQSAEADLKAGLAKAREMHQTAMAAAFEGALGNLALQAQDPGTALSWLDRSIATARTADAVDILAASTNNKGNVLAATGDPVRAIQTYRQAAGYAATAADLPLQGTIAVNLARAWQQTAEVARSEGRTGESGADMREAGSELAAAARITSALPPTRDQVVSLVAIARAGLSMPGANGADLALMETVSRQAVAIANRLGGIREQSLAAGTLADVLEASGQRSEAARLTRSAIWTAQLVDAKDLLWRWEWLNGRLAAAAGDRLRAIGAYRRAVETLGDVRLNLPVNGFGGRSSFRHDIGPLYFDLIDQQLAEADRSVDDTSRRNFLAGTLRTIESFELSEVANFYHDPCVRPQERLLAPDSDYIGPHDAILYPIIRPGHIDVVVSLPGATPKDPRRLIHHRTPVVRSSADLAVHRLRGELEVLRQKPEEPARQLYDWIIRPVWDEIAAAGVDTLVVVPDGALRTIPFAALQDGNRFMIERLAVVTEPSVTLTGRYAEQTGPERVLLSGTSEEITYTEPHLRPLANVDEELDDLLKIYPNADTLRDRSFTVMALRNALRQVSYNIVHIAAHAVFGDTPEESQFFADDGPFSLNMLEAALQTSRVQDRPLDMLVLSACSTADGNDLAALGLAGIGVKAGARTAIGALWSVDGDVATDLMRRFYRYLANPSLTKARAFQLAQLDILHRKQPRQPYAWAPFLLIGSGR